MVPKFITPNYDYNDSLMLNGLEYFNSSEIKIFDSYGKLIKSGAEENFNWDGTVQGKNHPASDYWYKIRIED